MSSKDRVRWAVAAAIILVIVGWFGYRVVTATWAHTYWLEYATLPADDEALAAWLRSQPGVSAPSVTREGNTLVVQFKQRSLWMAGGPNVVGEADRLGYSGLRRSSTHITGGLTLW
jgi:hypothetical protein